MKMTVTNEDQEFLLSDEFLVKLADSNVIIIKSKVAYFVVLKSKGEAGINAKFLAFSLYDDDYIKNIKESFKEIKQAYQSGIVLCGYLEGMIAGSTEFGEVTIYLF